MNSKAIRLLEYITNLRLENEGYKILKIEPIDDEKECFRLSLEYENIVFYIKLINENERLYWKLEPYNNSYFQTEAKSNELFSLVLAAMKKHVELLKILAR